jgi:MinD-like ATPase involved in chromosome partitioning or flagellar assembly/CheY-like chemotaxis protein
MPPKCSVLLIEDSPDSAMLVNHFLGASKIAQFHVVSAASLQAAREILGRERFDAILLDLNLPDSRGLETFARVRESARGAAIVILTGVEDEGVATTAIGRGAADYLIKGEVGGEGLARRIRFAIERSRAAAPPPAAARAGRVLVVMGAKGGAGASTMALNLATALRRDDKNVLLVELRPHGGSLGTMLNLTSVLTLDAIAELGGTQTLDAASGKLPFGIRLLAAPAGLSGPAAWAAEAVEALLDRAAGTSDYVVVDAAPAHPELAKAAVGKAWFTLLVVEREPVSVQLAGRMGSTLASWAGRPNAVGAVLVNHMPFMDAAPLPVLRAELNCGIVGVMPPAREALQSYRRQGPIVLAQPGAPVSMSYLEIAARIDHDPVQFLL